ncbi:MAG TPA: PEP-CTERM sorting domain-containing protein [Tepidisphaeraceae bacterium]|nr:PEP-CTERM sorting domain-containing protein [Tepidisphaeraceae bacterium]
MSRRAGMSLAAVAAAVLAGSASAAPVAYTVVRQYDDTTATNAVATNSSGNALSSTAANDVAGFTGLVATAFDNGAGGVVNFETASNDNPDGFTAAYGTGKVLAVASSTNVNHTTLSTLTVISGTQGLIPTASATTAWRLSFGGITGGDPGEAVVQAGFTLLSRDAKTQVARVEWFIDGDTTTAAFTDDETITQPKSFDDTFFGYTAPAGSAITSVRISFDTTGLVASDDRLGIDDLGFITAPVPEPATVSLLALGAMPLLGRRRRPR